MFDLRQLNLLQAVARTGSYSAAGRELGYTQPAVTYQMRNLERQVNAPIAVRVGRTMRLTRVGQELLTHADRITALIRAVEHDMAVLVDQHSDVVRLAAFPSACATLAPEAIVALNASFPAIDVRLIQAEPAHARELVRRGEADLALCYGFASSPYHQADPPPPDSPLQRLPVLTEDVALILPAGHPAAAQKVIDIRDLSEDVFFVAGERFQAMVNQAAKAAGFTPKINVIADDYVVMQSLVGYGLGVAFVPELALAVHRDERIVPRTLGGWPRRVVELETWPDLMRVHAVAALTDLLRKRHSRSAGG